MTLDELLADPATGHRWLTDACGIGPTEATHLLGVLTQEHRDIQLPGLPTAPGQVWIWHQDRAAPAAALVPPVAPAAALARVGGRRRPHLREALRCAVWTLISWCRPRRPEHRVWTFELPPARLSINDQAAADRAERSGS